MRDVRDINYQRGERAFRALLAYGWYNTREHAKEDVEVLAIDLLTDLRHMLVDYSGDLDELCKVSKEHFEVEKAE